MRLFALIGGVVVLLLVAALAVPPLVDWSSYRADFERQASRVLGQKVKVSGATSARLLPLPKIEFEQVEIGADAEGAPLLSLDRLAMDVEIAPLMKGEVVVVSMELERPRGRLRVEPDGSVDWFERNVALRVPASDISIETLRIRDGSLTVVDAARDIEVEISAVDAVLAADTLAGPWRGEGSFVHAGETYSGSGTTGRLKRDGEEARIATRLTLTPTSLPYDLTLTGPVTLSEAGTSLAGSFAISPSSEVEEGAVAPVSIDGSIEIDRRQMTLPGFTVRIGEGADPYRLEGNGRAFFEGNQRYAVRLRGSQVDVDSLAREDSEAALGFDERLAVVTDLLRRMPLPALPGDVKIDLPAVVAGDTVLRELSADLRPLADRSGWTVSRFVATLPGRTLLEASGELGVPRRSDGSLSFTGNLLLASRQPSGFANWLAADVDDTIRRLGSAGLEAKVVLGEGAARFDDLELLLGGDRLTGTLAWSAAEETGRPRILANLEGNRVDLSTMRSLFGLFSGADIRDRDLLAHDLDLRMRAETVAGFGTEATEVDVVALFEKGDLIVDRLSIGSVDGVSLALQGSVASLYERPAGSVSGTVSITEPTKLVAALAKRGWLATGLQHFRRDPGLLSGTRLDVAAKAGRAGPETEIAVDVKGAVGTSRLTSRMEYQGDLGATRPRIEFALDARNDTPLTLLRQLGLRPVAVDLPGPATLTAQAKGRPDAIELDVALETPAGRVATAGQTEFVPGQGDRYSGRFDLSGSDIDPFLMASGLGFPGIGTGTTVKLGGAVVADADGVALDGLKGSVRGNPIEASLFFDPNVQPRPRLDGDISLGSLDLTTLMQMVLGPQFEPSAFVGGEREKLGAPLLAGLDGAFEVKSSQADLGLGLMESAPASDVSGEVVLTDGDLQVENMKADWLGGRLTGNAGLAKAGANASLSADLKLTNADVEKTRDPNAMPSALSGRFDIDVALESQAATAAGLVAGLSGGATVRLQDARLRGFSPSSFAALLNAADDVKDERLEAASPTIASKTLMAGSSPVAELSMPMTVANGVARASGVGVTIGGVPSILDLRVDLARAEASGSLNGTFVQPPKAPPVEGIAPDFEIFFGGTRETAKASLDATTLTTYLTTRLRERREREFVAQRAAILERQRLVRAMRLSRAREQRALELLRARQRLLSPEPVTPEINETSVGTERAPG